MPAPGRPAVRSLLQLFLSLHFRKLHVTGAGRVPGRGPLLVLGPATDAVLDPLLALYALPRPLRLLAHAPLFEGKRRAALLSRLGFVPGPSLASPGGPKEVVSWCEHALVTGEAVALFLNGPCGNPLAPSSARIGAEALAAAWDRGVRPSAMVVRWASRPKFPRRGRGQILFSFPFLVGEAGGARPSASDLEARLDGTAELPAAELVWHRELELLDRAAPIARRKALPPQPSNDPEGAPQGVFEERCQWAWLNFPLKFKALVREAGAYFELLDALGVKPVEEMAAPLAVPDSTYFTLLFAVGGFPAALYGWAFHALPFTCAKWLAREWARERRRAYGALLWRFLLVTLPIFYAFQTWGLWELLGPWKALVFASAALPAGLWALLYPQLTSGAGQSALALARYRLSGRLERVLGERRRALLFALEPLLWLYREDGDELSGP